MPALTAEQIEQVYSSDDSELQQMVHQLLTDPYYSFEPRPDNPSDYDEQTAFVESDAKFSICLGGNASGKTESAAFKTAHYIRETVPPRPHVPFWIIGESYALACGVCWKEKLSKYIPPWMIHSKVYYQKERDWPLSVLLKHPTIPNEIGWILEFKSYEQGREMMQAASIAGFWFNEDAPLEIVEEVMARTRDYSSPGWADFTPVNLKSPEWVDRYHNPPDGWKFFHLNMMRNTALPKDWAEWYLSSQVTEDIRETRRIGVFTSFQGMVFKEWRPDIHIKDPFPIPKHWRRFRAIDFGFNDPFVCLWIARDTDGNYYVYDEYYDARSLNRLRADAIHARDWDYTNPFYGQTYSDHDAQQRAEFAALGIHTTPARKAIDAGIERLRTLMMVPRLFVFRNCVELIKEIPRYRWSKPTGKGDNQKNPKPLPIDFANHCIDAMRYGIFSEEIELLAGLPQKHMVRRDRARHGTLIANAERRDYDKQNRRNGNGNGHDPAAGMMPY